MFKPRSDAVRIGQDSLIIPCKNGNQFTENNIIRFDIPRNVGFMDGANSYLEFEVEIGVPGQAQNAAQPCMMLDPLTGGHSVIDRIMIRSEGRLIEELNSYNVYSALHYSATDNEGNINKRSLLEGCSKSLLPQDNVYIQKNAAITPATNPNGATGLMTDAQSWKYIRRKVCLPLLGGIFRNTRAHPCLAMPLEIEIILAQSVKVLRLCETADAVPCDDTPGGGAQNFLIVSNRARFNSIGGGTAETPQAPLEGEGLINASCNFPFRVGQVVRLAGGGTTIVGNHTIAAIEQFSTAHGTAADVNKLRIQFGGLIDAAGAATGVSMHSLDVGDTPLAEHGNLGYSVNQPRLVVQKVIPPPSEIQAITRAIAKGSYSQDIITWTAVNNAIPASQTTSTNIIPADLTRVKSILSVPLTQAVDSLVNSNSLYGMYLNADRYQYQINNKLVPDRRINLSREAFPARDAVDPDDVRRPYVYGQYHEGAHLWEVEKALRSANINVTQLNKVTLNNGNFVADYPGVWLVARSLASGVGSSMNLVNKSVILYLDYATTSNMVKLLHNFLVHIRTLTVSMEGAAVFY